MKRIPLVLVSVLVAACLTEVGDETDVSSLVCAPIPKASPDREEREAIEAMGFCGSSAVDAGDGYVVEDDIFIAKSGLHDKQIVHDVRIDRFPLTVLVHPSLATGDAHDFTSAVQAAINAWNAIPDTGVRLVFTTASTADIRVMDDEAEGGPDIGGEILARGDFPGSDPGGRIRINLSAPEMPLTESQKIRLVAHELGHTIGFRHTNARHLGDLEGTPINGTPADDPTSVMNGGEEYKLATWSGFSTGDRDAARIIYPEIVTLQIEYAGCTSGIPRMVATWGGTFMEPYQETWQLDRFVNGAFTLSYSGTGQTKTFNVPSGQQLKLRVRANTKNGWSDFKIVSKTAPSCSTLPQ